LTLKKNTEGGRIGLGSNLLELNNVEVVFNDFILVLKGISLEVPKGSIVALLGSNGAGKTTTLKTISGLIKPERGKVTRGHVIFNGKRIENRDPVENARDGIIQVMEGRRIFEELTVEENLKVGCYMNGSEVDLELVYNYFPNLKKKRNLRAGYLSGGEQQMLAIGRALLTKPKLLLLDEPSLGLAPKVAKEIFDIIRRINEEEGVTILLVEQNAKIALDLAEYGYVMENGRIVLDGEADKLKNNEDVKEFYMGITDRGRKNYREAKRYRRRKRWLS